jgi:hypothetical protein
MNMRCDMKRIASVALVLLISITSCSGLTLQQQRILNGGAIGAAGAGGGAIVHEVEKGKK